VQSSIRTSNEPGGESLTERVEIELDAGEGQLRVVIVTPARRARPSGVLKGAHIWKSGGGWRPAWQKGCTTRSRGRLCKRRSEGRGCGAREEESKVGRLESARNGGVLAKKQFAPRDPLAAVATASDSNRFGPRAG